jgi:quercetin dioxygenase-like cupin family protein
MKMGAIPFTLINWEQKPVDECPGDTGRASIRMVEANDVRIRTVEYTPGYSANHWCDRGHVVFVIEGNCTVELQNGRSFLLTAGMSFCVGDGIDLHRAVTETGCKVFIVD